MLSDRKREALSWLRLNSESVKTSCLSDLWQLPWVEISIRQRNWALESFESLTAGAQSLS